MARWQSWDNRLSLTNRHFEKCWLPPRVLLFFKDLITRYGITQLRLIYNNFDVSPYLKTSNWEEKRLKFIVRYIRTVSISQINYPQNAIDILTTLKNVNITPDIPFCHSCLQVGCQEIEGFEGDWKISFSSGFGERPFLPHQVTQFSSVLAHSHFIKLDRYIPLSFLSHTMWTALGAL